MNIDRRYKNESSISPKHSRKFTRQIYNSDEADQPNTNLNTLHSQGIQYSYFINSYRHLTMDFLSNRREQ